MVRYDNSSAFNVFFMYRLLSLFECTSDMHGVDLGVSHDTKFPDLTEEAAWKPYMWIFFAPLCWDNFRRLAFDIFLSNPRI